MNNLLTGHMDISNPRIGNQIGPDTHREVDAFCQACLKKVSRDLPKGVPGSLITQQLSAMSSIENIHNKWKLSVEKGDTTPYPHKDILLHERRFTDSLENFLQKSPGFRHLYNQINPEG